MTENRTLEQLNLCLKTAHMGIWEATVTKDPYKAADVVWDEEVRRMHGVPEGQKIDPIEWFFSHVHPEDLPTVTATNKKLLEDLRTSAGLRFQYRVRWPNGEVHFIEMHGSVDTATEDGKMVKIYGVAKDITQDVIKQKFIEDQKTRLLSTSRMAVLGEISGGIAHEINNPLTVIQARAFQLLQMAENGNLDAAKIKSASESISKTGDKIAKIVKSLRAFAHSQDDSPIDSINVREIIQETLDFCKVRFYNHGIDIRIGDIPDDLEFECHLIQIEEALLNLFNNSHDAIASLPEKWILIEAFEKDDNVEIHVTDSGSGIPKDVADNIMLPFFSTKEMGKGMGLGLCIVSEIVMKHHGEIYLDRTSANTKFVLRLPKFQPKTDS
ncbi:sensor histidine kinase [Bdellovibrio sp. HCB337]|uniref:sensor histidine kinase n=1 Tax=Bdellovibrio sp. HCB337 TaxID=3394358 RepID=UPI0039A51E67